MAVADIALLLAGSLILVASPWLIWRRWIGKDNEDRLLRDGVPRPAAIALTGGVAAVPVMGLTFLLGSGVFDRFAWSTAALGIAWLLMVFLTASLGFFLFPRFLIPPRLRHEQSLASRAFFGAKSTEPP